MAVSVEVVPLRRSKVAGGCSVTDCCGASCGVWYWPRTVAPTFRLVALWPAKPAPMFITDTVMLSLTSLRLSPTWKVMSLMTRSGVALPSRQLPLTQPLMQGVQATLVAFGTHAESCVPDATHLKRVVLRQAELFESQ